MARVQNGSGNPFPKNIRFLDNEFHCTNGIGFIGIETAESVTLDDNDLRNVKIGTNINNQYKTTILDNTVIFTVAAGSAFNAIEVGSNNGGGEVTITGNRLDSYVAQPAGTRGIYNAQFDTFVPPLAVIAANRVKGLPIPIETSWTGTGGGANVSTTEIRDNIVPAATTIVRTEAGTNPSRVVQEGNRLSDLTPYPAPADIGNGTYWDVGQMFWYPAPASGGYIGKVCTTAGAPGTTKDWGVIT
jgi:hypothetical protein